ncbi:hypothetical protein HY485_03905 [Candidatus Woesearchaeota archaeon]|nr:hypothetical protein [Candidatus Woesearchaeota archaeon]
MRNKKERKGCTKCGYTKIDLHGGKCPMCEPCSECRETIKSCTCKEGE